jgi:hypothetical protein
VTVLGHLEKLVLIKYGRPFFINIRFLPKGLAVVGVIVGVTPAVD